MYIYTHTQCMICHGVDGLQRWGPQRQRTRKVESFVKSDEFLIDVDVRSFYYCQV